MAQTAVQDATANQPLPEGTPAPDFRLHSTPNERVALSDFRGRPVIIAFYPADWSPVCSDQMALYQEIMPEFKKFDAGLMGISVDGSGVTTHSRGTATSGSRSSPTSSPSVRSHGRTTRTDLETASANELSMSSIRRGRCTGATSRRSA